MSPLPTLAFALTRLLRLGPSGTWALSAASKHPAVQKVASAPVGSVHEKATSSATWVVEKREAEAASKINLPK